MDQWVREQYKSKGGFGMKTLETRRSATVVNRKEQRNTLLKKFRNIPETMSPLMSPMVQKVRKEQEPGSKKDLADKKSKRLLMLKKWKEEKEKKKLEEKKKAKPVFKVFHVDHKENVQDVYKTIKGKMINTKGKSSMTPLVPNKTSNPTMALRTFNFRPEKTESSNIQKNQRNVLPKNCNNDTRAEQKLPKNSKKTGVGQSKSEKNPIISKPNSTVKTLERHENVNKRGNKNSTSSAASSQQNKSKSTAKNRVTTSEGKRRSKGTSHPENEGISVPEETLSSGTEIPSFSEETLSSEYPTDHNGPETKSDSDDVQNDIKNSLAMNENVSSGEKIEQKTPRRSRRIVRKDTIEKEETLPSNTSYKTNKQDKTSSRNSSNKSGKSLVIDSNSAANSQEDDVFSTPKQSEDEICYVSPFVTMSRGKSAARKEFEQRKSLNGSIFNTSLSGSTDPRSPRAAASYFTRILDDEIARIQSLCKIWQSYKDEGNISEDACGLIDMTIGQSNLLITKKFNQFRGLIERCRSNDEVDNIVQCEDLHGFWDMIYKQVTDLDKRFDNLEDMKKNNWLEEVPKVKTPKVAVKTKKKGRSKSTKASSGLKETILAARKFRMKQNNSEGDVEILIAGKKGTPRRISKNIKEIGTPGKGILKSANAKSEKRKTVVFHNLIENLDDKVNSTPLFKGTPIPSRRSQRISLNRSKLTFDE